MSVEWFDLGMRLHAAATGRPANRLHHAPINTAANPVAVRAHTTGHTVQVSAAAADEPTRSAAGRAALTLLADLGATLTADTPATLVTDDPTTLPLLHRLARTVTPDSPDEPAAAHIAWWADRADFPGGSAVADLLTACQTRWVTGSTPTAERRPSTWRTWLQIADDTPRGMLTVHELLTAATPLRLLDTLAEDTQRSYRRAQSAHTDGHDWRRPDSPGRAALGLRSRCDAADLYAAALLGDPTYRRRGVHSGHVVTGTATPLPGRSRRVEVACLRMDARLRPGNNVTGWVGHPDTTTPAEFSGQVTAAAVAAGVLHLTLTGVTGSTPTGGDPVTLIPAPPSTRLQYTGRSNLIALYGSRRSWLTTGRTPTPTRRDVPLDVLVAGAEQP